MLLDLHHIRTFVVVAVTCNFTRAAKELGCSQPTVTLHIRTLERQLGAVLFERKPFSKVHSLTAAGRHVYEYAVKLLSLADEIPSAVKQLSSAGLTIDPPPNAPKTKLPILHSDPAHGLDPSRPFIRHSVRHKSKLQPHSEL